MRVWLCARVDKCVPRHCACCMRNLLKKRSQKHEYYLQFLSLYLSLPPSSHTPPPPFLYFTHAHFFLLAVFFTSTEISFYSLNWLLSLHKQKSQMKRDGWMAYSVRRRRKKCGKKKQEWIEKKEFFFICLHHRISDGVYGVEWEPSYLWHASVSRVAALFI